MNMKIHIFPKEFTKTLLILRRPLYSDSILENGENFLDLQYTSPQFFVYYI